MANLGEVKVWHVIHIFFRLFALGISVGALVVLVKLSLRWANETFPVPVAAVCLAMLVDSIQMINLLRVMLRDGEMQLLHIQLGVIAEFVVVGLVVAGIALIAVGDVGRYDGMVPKPELWAHTESVTFILLVVVIALRLVFLTWGCVDGCLASRTGRGRRRRSSQERYFEGVPASISRINI